MNNLFKAVKTYKSLENATNYLGYTPHALSFIHFEPIEGATLWRFGGPSVMFQGRLNLRMNSMNNAFVDINRFYYFLKDVNRKAVDTLNLEDLPLENRAIEKFNFDLCFDNFGRGEPYPLEKLKLLERFEKFLKKNNINSVEVVKTLYNPFINFKLPYCDVLTRGLGDLK